MIAYARSKASSTKTQTQIKWKNNMKKKALKFVEAVEAFQTIVERTRAIPPQPSAELSELRGTTWFLRNTNGPLARVNSESEVKTSKKLDELIYN